MTKPVDKIITIEEHFMLKEISQKVSEFNGIQNGGGSTVSSLPRIEVELV
jgi:hypothetical protein